MKQTVDFQTFRDTFRAYDRADQFSREGLELLFDHLEEMERDNGVEAELDVVALCCDYTEDTPESIAQSYGLELPDDETEEEHAQAVMDYLCDNTTVVGQTSGGSIIYVNF